jgi:ABC-type glycerol-3-phosphate transport system substrate-binding protein
MMKKCMVLFTLLILTCLTASGSIAETSAGSGMKRLFEDRWITSSCLGSSKAYLCDRDGVLWCQAYDEAAPHVLCTLPKQPEALNNGQLTYEKLSDADRAQADETVQVLAEAEGVLYAVNQYAGRIGTVNEQGVQWLEQRFDASFVLSPDDGQRQIMSAVMQDGSLYLLADYWEEDPAQNQNGSVVRISVSTGETVRIKTPGTLSMCLYKEGLLLLRLDEQGKYCLTLLNPGTGEMQDLPIALPKEEEALICYQADGDKLYLATKNGVYCAANEEPFSMILNNPAPNSMSMSGKARIVENGSYALWTDGVFVMPLTNEAGKARVLTLCMCDVDTNLQQAFMKEHPDVLLNVHSQELTAADIADRIRSGDTETDIFRVSVNNAFGKLKDSAYAAGLNDSPEIVKSVAAMYPQIRAALIINDGQIVAYPQDLYLNLWSVNTPLWEKHFGNEPIPTTWKALFEVMLRFEETDDVDGDLFLIEWSYQDMVIRILNAYMEQHDAAGGTVDFSDHALSDTLMALSRVNDCMVKRGITYQFEGDIYPENEMMNRSVFYIGGGGISTYKAGLVGSDDLMPFTFAQEEEPVIHGYMSVLIVNPLSVNQELARDYIDCATKQETNLTRYYMLHADATEPVEKLGWQEQLQSYIEQEETLKAQIDAAEDPLKLTSLQDELSVVQRRLSQQEFIRWQISPDGIAALQKIEPQLRFFERSLLVAGENGAMQEQMEKLCARYTGGQMTLDALLQQMNDVARLIYLEQQ